MLCLEAKITRGLPAGDAGAALKLSRRLDKLIYLRVFIEPNRTPSLVTGL